MNGEQLLKARLSRNWEQTEAARKLKVSQPYLSLLEAGKRPVTEALVRRAVQVFNLPPTALPIKDSPQKLRSNAPDSLASQLAALGYPKFAHLKKKRRVNPASVLISALLADDLDSRIVEALPWLIMEFADLDWTQVTKAAKLGEAQNRIGFLVSLAYELAKKSEDKNKAASLKGRLAELERIRQLEDDSFGRTSLTKSERAWLKRNRPRTARHWRILSNLKAEHLTY